MSRRKRAHDARHADFTPARVHTNFNELSAESEPNAIFQSRSAGDTDLTLVEILQLVRRR